MKVLDRYLLRELAVPLIIGTVIIAMLFVANEFIAIFKNFELSSIPFIAVVQMVAYRMPEWLSLTLPTGTAMGTALAVSRLTRESEITAMRAVGISVKRVALTMAMAGLAMSVANFLVVEKLIPPAAREYGKLRQKFFLLGAAPRFQSNVMIQLGRYTASMGTIQRADEGKLLITDVLLVERPRADEIWLTSASKGVYNSGVWTLDGVRAWVVSGDRLTQFTTKDQVLINERIRVEDVFSLPEPSQETTETLQKAIASGRALGQSTTELEVAFHVKYSLPASCLLFAVTSALFAMWLSRAGPFMGVLVSLGLVMLYYNAYIISTEIIGKNGWLSPPMAAWLPNILCLILGLVALRRVE